MNLKLTPSGTDLLRRAVAGEAQIHFTEIQLGNGADAGQSAIALSNPLLTVQISSCTVDGIFVALTAIFNNIEVSSGFRATELGVFVTDPDSAGDTMLYAYGYTDESKADYIPTGVDRVLESQMDVLVYIGDADNVTASISQSLVYAGKAEFEAHLADHNNPHGVTKAQVELGNVPNVSTNDQTPTYTTATSLTPLTSGEKLKTAFGKLAKAIASLISHLADNARHISAEERNAWNSKANASHSHSTASITSGTLGVGRGGTGKSLWSSGGLIYASSVDQLAQVSPPAANNMVLFGRSNGAPAWQRISYSGTYTGSGRTGAPYDTSITIAYAGDPKMLLIMKVGSTCFGQFMFSGNAATGMTYVDEQWIPMHCSWSDEGPNVVIEWRNAREIEYAIPASQLDEAGAIYIYTVLF